MAVTVLAVLVQILVWGSAPTSGTGGSALPGLRPGFGTSYAIALLLVELGYCLYFGLKNTAVAVLVAAAVVDVVFWSAYLAGLRFAIGAAAAMTAAFGAVALGVGVWWPRPGPGRSR